ncbi:HAD family hydrolase [Aquimonas voraii]|uniref:HAD-superfamily subfamily IB hydrolase, TIGR01490 n=1 Tax=Aquimonas voraii TaxID=265719 RepID=A0A1G6UHZ4_9GAMM|nr:HAD family hydrolase [Aquimonas voraii]SDD40982.1 HAD-superfamily subfamily IB hydrolase, TIGR01490 [Aquimonas voraii]
MPTRSDLALFDFDGTLTTCETFPVFLKRVLPRSRLRAGWLRLWPLVLGYRLRLVSGTRLRSAIVRLGFTGADREALEREGVRFAADYLPGVLRPEAMARLLWHRQRGDRVVIVSGGLGTYLRPWAAAQGLELLCSELETVDGRCTGVFAGAQCVGAEKARRVRGHIDLAAYAEVHAYGDTPEDAELLALADHRHYRGRRMSRADRA